jgi:hypothetical protein
LKAIANAQHDAGLAARLNAHADALEKQVDLLEQLGASYKPADETPSTEPTGAPKTEPAGEPTGGDSGPVVDDTHPPAGEGGASS